MARISIKDLAKAAGVSHSTVSRALQGRGRIATHTRQRIQYLAQSMGYSPSLVARSLVTQRTMTLGLVVTTLADPFHAEVVRGVEEVALEAGYSVFLATSNTDPLREMQVVRNFQERRVDGIIVSASRVGDRYSDLLNEMGIPIVLINNHAQGASIHSVSHDDYDGAYRITEYLIAAGYRRIAYLGNERGGKAQQDRRKGWAQALRPAGLAAPTSLCSSGPDGRFDSGRLAIERLLHRLAQPPDAIVCYNDVMAISAMRVLKEHGLRTPEDIGITGFDDILFAQYTDPPLTTLAQPKYEMGRQAMRMLLELLDPEAHPVSRRVVLKGELVVRGSTRQLKEKTPGRERLETQTNALYSREHSG